MKTKLAFLVIALGFAMLAATPRAFALLPHCAAQPPCGTGCHTWTCGTFTGCCPDNALCICGQ